MKIKIQFRHLDNTSSSLEIYPSDKPGTAHPKLEFNGAFVTIVEGLKRTTYPADLIKVITQEPIDYNPVRFKIDGGQQNTIT